MTEQNININFIPEVNANNFWVTHPPPNCTPSQPLAPIYNIDYRMPFIRPFVSSYNRPTQINNVIFNNTNFNYLNNQNQYTPYDHNASNSFPSLPDNIDQEYILTYLCPVPKATNDSTNIWIQNWLATKKKQCMSQSKKTANNIKIHEFSNKVKECKQLLEIFNNNKQLMEQNMSTMKKPEWENACSNLFFIKEKIDIIIKSLNLDNNVMCELKFKLTKRKNKRDRLKRIKSDLKNIKSQKRDEIIEINRKIDAWQNTFKDNILKQKRADKTKTEANFVLKGVRGKIDDAKNQLSLLDTLEKLRNIRLQNFVNKRKNSLLEESFNKLKSLWQHKLTDYNKEEDNLKNMLFKAEEEKHEKREIDTQKNLTEWDKILFGTDFRSQEVIFDDIHTFLNIRRSWDKYVVSENETSESSCIPAGWIIPSVACNSDWAKYSNIV